MPDINITIIDRDKKAHQISVPTDMNMNLMEACKSYDFPIEGICGGMAMCASCHVYVNSNQLLNNISDINKYDFNSLDNLMIQLPQINESINNKNKKEDESDIDGLDEDINISKESLELNNQQLKLIKLMSKYCVLSIISIFSSFFRLFLFSF